MRKIRSAKIVVSIASAALGTMLLQCSEKKTTELDVAQLSNDKELTDKTVSSPLYAPLKKLKLGPRTKAPENMVWSGDDTGYQLEGKVPTGGKTLLLFPPGAHWDISDHSYLRIDFTNKGKGLVWVKGRLDNKGAQGFANSTASSAIVLPGERVTLGFPYPRTPEQNDAPHVFDTHSGKPNGHRTHWKRFDPKLVLACRLNIQSSTSDVSLHDIQIHLAHKYGAEENKARMQLPYLDRFGQVRADDWLGKMKEESELLARHKKEESVRDAGPKSFNPYGGWANGPKLKATGYFYTTKHDGKWWLVDPTGGLFFSQGINTVGFLASTPMSGVDRKTIFEWLPQKGEPLRKVAILTKKNRTQAVSYIRANAYRTFGANWRKPALARIHHRMRYWGMNTLGAWSDQDLFFPEGETRTPYTEILHVWRKNETRLTDDTPDPFTDDFDDLVRKGLENIVSERGHDPWCLGVFIDNETDWPNDLVQRVFAKPANQPAKKAFIAWLKNKYGDVSKLNSAWRATFNSWDAMQASTDIKEIAARKQDFVKLYTLLADRYYQTCRDEMRRVMPNHLYLGSRIHTCPEQVRRSCAKYTDVYSSNKYEAVAGRGGLPGDLDKPVMISEYHFAAPDRGVPGVGLSPVGDQYQRSRSFAAYVTAGILHPNIVGVHWFAYADQSAAGRPYENYQIGFVDVTDTPYPIITEMARSLANQMYQMRSEKSGGVLKPLETILQD
jgi:hypothetical protein